MERLHYLELQLYQRRYQQQQQIAPLNHHQGKLDQDYN